MRVARVARRQESAIHRSGADLAKRTGRGGGRICADNSRKSPVMPMAATFRKRARREELRLTRREFAALDRLGHAAEDPDVPQRHPGQSRAWRRDDSLRARGVAAASRALHRRRVRRCLRAVAARRPAARHAHGLRAQRLSACRRAVPPRRRVGCDFQDQRRGAALSRSGLPDVARTRDVVFPRVQRQARPQDAAQPFRRPTTCGGSIRRSG